MKHPSTLPCLVYADSRGNITEFEELGMTGMSNNNFHRPALKELIPLPRGSELFALPGRHPVGWQRASEEAVLLDEDPYKSGENIQAVAAFIAPAHTSIYSSSYQSTSNAPTLPLFAYTAVGWYRGQFWVTAFRSDTDVRQDSDQYEQQTVNKETAIKLSQFPDNRLIQHLGKCCLSYGCPAARNYFLGRWEAPLPTSPSCNARCLGCISLQESGSCPGAQERIEFVPSPAEISEIATEHLQNAQNPIVSFGQGCEGEPLLQADIIAKAIVDIRGRTARGTINLNSNGSLPPQVKILAEKGLDAMRVSLNSAREEYYNRYYRPKNYQLGDVLRSMKMMKDADRYVSLNYFILPGFTDSREEFDALCTVIEDYRVDLIQLRNLNIDPQWYLQTMSGHSDAEPMGIIRWLGLLKSTFPALAVGYFNPQVATT